MSNKCCWVLSLGLLLIPLAVIGGPQSIRPLEIHVNEDDIVFSIISKDKANRLSDLVRPDSRSDVERLGQARFVMSYRIPEGGFRSLVQVSREFEPTVGWFIAALIEDARVEWVNFNYEYRGDPIESIQGPNDPLFEEQIHHSIMQTPFAWQFTKGSPEVVVAITDVGFDMFHEDLDTRFWRNLDEVSDNGIDDDGNGYVDDHIGWDFSGNDNNPEYEIAFSTSLGHGTHLAGIIAGTLNNERGIAGVAPKVKIMPIRYLGSSSWTSLKVAKAFKYAADNGAKIISTSSNIDGFVDDPIFQSALEYVYEAGVLHINSAGNGHQENPPRQKFNELILVCNTTIDEEGSEIKSASSNWGDGIDLCAPGNKILSTLPFHSYGPKSGTSMSAAVVAGVAALVWSLHPDWTRDQVAAQIIATADNLDKSNVRYAGKLGGGRVNSLRAVAGRPAPPRIQKLKLQGQSLFVSMKRVLDRVSVGQQRAWKLIYCGEDSQFGTSDDRVVALQAPQNYKIGQNVIELKLQEELQTGSYRFQVDAEVLKDPFGQALDGNGNGKPGGDFIEDFIFELEPLQDEFDLEGSLPVAKL